MFGYVGGSSLLAHAATNANADTAATHFNQRIILEFLYLANERRRSVTLVPATECNPQPVRYRLSAKRYFLAPVRSCHNQT